MSAAEPGRAEARALRMAMDAYAVDGDERTRILAASRAFRDAMPPRRRRPEDDQPYHEKGGKAALNVIAAESAGLLRQRPEEILSVIGRALIEGAYPTIRYRRSLGLPNYSEAGRVAKQVRLGLARTRPRATEDYVCRAIAVAALRAAWPEEVE